MYGVRPIGETIYFLSEAQQNAFNSNCAEDSQSDLIGYSSSSSNSIFSTYPDKESQKAIMRTIEDMERMLTYGRNKNGSNFATIYHEPNDWEITGIPGARKEIWSLKKGFEQLVFTKQWVVDQKIDTNANTEEAFAQTSCYLNVIKVDHFFRTTYQRNVLNSAVEHSQTVKVYLNDSTVYNNAHWQSGGQYQGVHFGYVDPSIYLPLELNPDVLAHELGHGFVNAVGCLAYKGQSGALNESIADTIASMVKQFIKEEEATEFADWSIANVVRSPDGTIGALRSMQNPGRANRIFDNQITHMNRYKDTSEDNGGVHKYSSIPNLAFCKASIAVGGYAWEKVGKCWLDTVSKTNDDTFDSFANKTMETAKKLKLKEGEINCIGQAWTAVGVNPEMPVLCAPLTSNSDSDSDEGNFSSILRHRVTTYSGLDRDESPHYSSQSDEIHDTNAHYTPPSYEYPRYTSGHSFEGIDFRRTTPAPGPDAPKSCPPCAII